MTSLQGTKYFYQGVKTQKIEKYLQEIGNQYLLILRLVMTMTMVDDKY